MGLEYPEEQKHGTEKQAEKQPASGLPQPLQPSGPPPAKEQPSPAAHEQALLEDEPASITLFRGPTFHVHAFPSRSRIEPQEDTSISRFLERIGWPAAEKQRLAEEATHPLPLVDAPHVRLRREIAAPTWLEGTVVALFLSLTFVLQALSLFDDPAYTSDEGNYMANAWAILQGKLTPYTFTYAHPPLGWIQIAAWADLTGGITSFGNAINSGRVLMLVLATASSLLLYLIARRLSGSRSAALLALVMYTLSPLSLLYRHEVLLENLGTFWLLLSLCLITNGKSRLVNLILAAVALGIALLSKGVFLLFLPVMLYAVGLYATRFQRRFSLIAFLFMVLLFASVYALFALLKGEMFPAGTLLGGTAPHPSLLATLFQTFQGPGPQAAFRASWNTWLRLDLVLLVAGGVAMFLNILGGSVHREQLLAALFTATFCLFLLTSSTVSAFAIVPLLPFLALNSALALNTSLHWLARSIHADLGRALLLVVLAGMLVFTGTQQAWALVGQKQTEPQQEALWWISDHVPQNAVVIGDSYLYTDLHDPESIGITNEEPFTHAHIYTDAALDPAIAVGELKQDWRTIDVLVLDEQMLATIRLDKRYVLLDQALHHAVLRAIFGSHAQGTLIEIYQVVHSA